MDVATQTIQDFLSSVSAKQPIPGGGAVAGLLTAMSSSLGQMVLAYTEGKKKYEEHNSLHASTVGILIDSSEQALLLANRDAKAYATLNELWKLDRDDPKRIESWDAAVTEAILAPLEVIDVCTTVLRALVELTGKTNALLNSDLVIAAILAEAGARSALLNVEINLQQMKESEAKNSFEVQAKTLVGCCKTLCASIETACKV